MGQDPVHFPGVEQPQHRGLLNQASYRPLASLARHVGQGSGRGCARDPLAYFDFIRRQAEDVMPAHALDSAPGTAWRDDVDHSRLPVPEPEQLSCTAV